MKITAMLVLCLALFSSFQLITVVESKNASQPHIIFILADDLVSIPHTRKQNKQQAFILQLPSVNYFKLYQM